jgi:hypothetical protein
LGARGAATGRRTRRFSGRWWHFGGGATGVGAPGVRPGEGVVIRRIWITTPAGLADG